MADDTGQRLRTRALIVMGSLSVALICGGWFLARVFTYGAHGGRDPSGIGAQIFDDVVQHVTDDYVDSMSEGQLYHKAIDGMLEGLHDPHTAYLTPDRLRRLTESTSGTYVGLGIQIDIRDGWITIIAPVPNSPAERAGIEAGDRLVEVNGQSTHGWTSDEATAALRGPEGSPLRLTVDRPGVEARIPFTIAREEIHVHPVRHAVMLSPGLGYVQTIVFGDSLARELRQSIDSLRTKGAHTVILDLRNNPGGLLAQGVAVSELFLNKGQTIVSMRGRSPGTTRTFVDETGSEWPNLGLIVLVNGSSASASEIVAGALQDHDRALIVGAPSYGKGSAQTLFTLDSGAALKLTTALWFTPSGRSINRPPPRGLDDDDEDDDSAATADSIAEANGQNRPTYKTDAGRTVYGGGGITPDVEVGDTAAAEEDLAFQRALGSQLPAFRDAVTSYVLSLKAAHAITKPDVTVTPAMRDALWQQMQAHHVTMWHEDYMAATPVLNRLLQHEIVRYVFGPEGEFQEMLQTDSIIHTAERLAAHATSPHSLVFQH